MWETQDCNGRCLIDPRYCTPVRHDRYRRHLRLALPAHPVLAKRLELGRGTIPLRMMVDGVYFVLGICLMVASHDPLANRSLIWLTAWSSGLHSVIMAIPAIRIRQRHVISSAMCRPCR